MTDDLITIEQLRELRDRIAVDAAAGNVGTVGFMNTEFEWKSAAYVRQLLAQPAGSGGAPASPQGWSDDATYIADVMPDWTTMQLPDGSSFAFKRENGMVYKLPHPDAPFIPLPAPPSSGDGRGVADD